MSEITIGGVQKLYVDPNNPDHLSSTPFRTQSESTRTPIESSPVRDEVEAREYADRMDFKNWFERTEGIPYVCIRELRCAEISNLVGRYAAHIRQIAALRAFEKAMEDRLGYDVAKRIAAAIRSGT